MLVTPHVQRAGGSAKRSPLTAHTELGDRIRAAQALKARQGFKASFSDMEAARRMSFVLEGLKEALNEARGGTNEDRGGSEGDTEV